MRYIVNREEMQSIDAYCIEKIGIPSMVLMERAAMAVTQLLTEYIEELELSCPARILIVTESGNNGGDGLAVARMLYELGYFVDVFQVGGMKRVSEQYQMQKDILEQLGIPVYVGITSDMIAKWNRPRYDVIVDAIFGVGLHREILSPQKEVIEALNQLGGMKCAIDIPSGIDSTTGAVLGTAFRADLTVTFGCEKLGQILGKGPEYCGDIFVADIGFPKKAIETRRPRCYGYETEDLTRLPVRKANGNKGTFGKVAVVAGSETVCGAAVLSATAAYRSGCGLVEIITHRNNREAIQKLLPEALLQVYENSAEAADLVHVAVQWADIMVVGPGIGLKETGQAILSEAFDSDCPLIVDADAITLLAQHKEWWNLRRSIRTEPNGLAVILTPHMKEMERISGRSMEQLKEQPCSISRDFAMETGAICVLKDARTVVAVPGEPEIYINLSGNDGMSVGGSGDVLTGVIAALAAQGASLEEAARLGVFLHGCGGDRAAEQKGHYSMIASDIIDGITDVLGGWEDEI